MSEIVGENYSQLFKLSSKNFLTCNIKIFGREESSIPHGFGHTSYKAGAWSRRDVSSTESSQHSVGHKAVYKVGKEVDQARCLGERHD